MVCQIMEVIGHLLKCFLSKLTIFKIYIDFFLLTVL